MVDNSSEALKVTEKNVEKFGLKEKVHIVEADLLSGFSEAQVHPLSKNLCMSANLPYIKNNDFENMARSVIDHEPDSALYGGEKTGFELYEKLIKQCFQLKNILSLENITLFIEIGFDQYEVSKSFLEEL